MNHLDTTQKFELPARRSDDRRSRRKVELSVRPNDRYPAATAAASDDNPALTDGEHKNEQWLTRGPNGDWYYYDGKAWIRTSPPAEVVVRRNDGEHTRKTPPATTGLLVLGYLSAVVALFVGSFWVGILGMYFGRRAKKQGDQKAGHAVVVTNGVCMAVGIIFWLTFRLATHSI